MRLLCNMCSQTGNVHVCVLAAEMVKLTSTSSLRCGNTSRTGKTALTGQCVALNWTQVVFSVLNQPVVWGIACLLSKEQGLEVQVSVVYCISDIRCAQDAKAVVSRGDAMLLRSLGYR